MSQGKGLEIPVAVKGANAAVADLSKVGTAVTGAGEAGKRAGDGLKKGTEGAEGFHRKGEMLFKQLVGSINPEMANLADLALDAVEGFSKLTPALLKVGAIGAAVGAVIAMFKDLASAIEEARLAKERFNEGMQKQRDRGLDLRGKLFESIQKAGIVMPDAGVQDIALGDVNKLMAAGASDQEAISAVVGSLMIAIGGKPGVNDQGSLLRAMALTGKGIDFEAKPEAGQSAEAAQAALLTKLESLRDLGDTPDADIQYRRALQAKGQKNIRQSLVGKEIADVGRAEIFDTLMSKLGTERPDLKADDLRIARRLAERQEGPLRGHESAQDIMAGVPEFGFMERFQTFFNLLGNPAWSEALLRKTAPGDALLPLEKLNDIAVNLRAAADAMVTAQRAASQDFVRPHITNNTYQNNVFEHKEALRTRPDPSAIEGLNMFPAGM